MKSIIKASTLGLLLICTLSCAADFNSHVTNYQENKSADGIKNQIGMLIANTLLFWPNGYVNFVKNNTYNQMPESEQYYTRTYPQNYNKVTEL